MKAKRYPAVAPNTASNPPLSDAKTGKPIKASNIYSVCAIVDFLGPKAAAPKSIAKVCKVIGIGVNGNGITTCALTIVSIVNKEI